MDIMPLSKAVGKADVVEPVPMYPTLGCIITARVEELILGVIEVIAPIDPEVPTNDPADSPALVNAAAAVGAAVNMVRAVIENDLVEIDVADEMALAGVPAIVFELSS